MSYLIDIPDNLFLDRLYSSKHKFFYLIYVHRNIFNIFIFITKYLNVFKKNKCFIKTLSISMVHIK